MSTTTLYSYNRPLTRAARRALEPYEIVDERSINEYGRWTEVDVKEEPPAEVLEDHELAVDREPVDVFEADGGEVVAIFDDVVEIDGRETTMKPDEARRHAESEGWQRHEA